MSGRVRLKILDIRYLVVETKLRPLKLEPTETRSSDEFRELAGWVPEVAGASKIKINK